MIIWIMNKRIQKKQKTNEGSSPLKLFGSPLKYKGIAILTKIIPKMYS